MLIWKQLSVGKESSVWKPEASGVAIGLLYSVQPCEIFWGIQITEELLKATSIQNLA